MSATRRKLLGTCLLGWALAAAPSGCAEAPVVTLGGDVDAGDADEDTFVDEAERERVFRELAQRECNDMQPVCGADGRTYPNYCQAVAFGIEVLKNGPC